MNSGKPSKAVCSNSSHGPSVFGDEDASFLWVWGGHLSDEGLVTCFRGDKGGQKVCPAPPVSHIPSTRNVHYSKLPYFGVVYSESRHQQTTKPNNKTLKLMASCNQDFQYNMGLKFPR